MISFVNYLMVSGISLSLFAGVYYLLLRRETFFSINRWFLLTSIGFSALLPLLHIPFYTSDSYLLGEVTVTPYLNLLSTVTIYGNGLTQGAGQLVSTYRLIAYAYLLGVMFFGGKLLFEIFQINRLIASNRVVPEGNVKLVILERELSPFSFLNYIFVSENLHSTNGWEKMLEHEKQHIRQGHTFDVLILEFIAVFQWFNPFYWLFRRALRENHEFLADQAVISQGTAPSWYKQILLNQYVGDQIVLTNNFNYSLVKNRIQMISKIKSRKIAVTKVMIGMILAISLIAVFSCDQKRLAKSESSHKYQIVNNEKVYQEVEQMPVYPGGDIELRKFISTSVRYPFDAMKNKIQGKVFVTFVVGKDGVVKNVSIARGADPLLDAEALRVVKNFPTWTPGKERGKMVAVQYTVPINFVLQ